MCDAIDTRQHSQQLSIVIEVADGAVAECPIRFFNQVLKVAGADVLETAG